MSLDSGRGSLDAAMQFLRVIDLQVDGDAEIRGSLTVDTIDEYTSGSGVTIEGVLLKDSDIQITGANYLQFRDAALQIASKDDGHIDIDFDVSLDLNAATDTDLVVNFVGTTNSGVLTWMEDEDYFKFSDDILLDSAERVYFRDTAIYVASLNAGYLDIEASTQVRINANTKITGDLTVTGDVTEELTETLLGDLIMGADESVPAAGDGDVGGDITNYRDVNGNVGLSYDADAAVNAIALQLYGGIAFRDNALTIMSKDDGHLDLDADTSIDLNANTVLTGTLDISSSLTVDTINEHTGAAGVTIESVVLKDSNVEIATDKKVQFRDAAIYIQSGDDGHLDLMADVSIDFNTGAETDLVLNFFGTTNSGVLTWMEDEDYFQFSDDILMSSTEKIQFRDAAIYISSKDDGHLDLDADVSVDINAALVLGAGMTMGGDLDMASYNIVGADEIHGEAAAESLVVAGHVTGGAPAQRDVAIKTGDAATPQALATRMLFGSNAAQGASLITAYEPMVIPSLKVSDLTATRVVFAAAAGELVDDADFTFATDTLTVTKIATTTFTGAITMDTTTKIQFRDAAIYIASLDDGHLDLEADTSIDLNALVVVGGNIEIGANLLKTTNLALVEGTADKLYLRNAANDAYKGLQLDVVYIETSVEFQQSGGTFSAPTDDNASIVIRAKDNGVGLVEIAKMKGAADPYFSMGGSQEFKFYNSGDALVALDKKLEFGDNAVYIFSDDDGYLDLVADTGIRMGATTFSGTIAANQQNITNVQSITGQTVSQLMTIDSLINAANAGAGLKLRSNSSLDAMTDRLIINAGVDTVNVDILNANLRVDVINEYTGAAGVTIDGLLIKDSGIPEAAVTAHEAALTILETQITDGAVLARVGGAESITAVWTFGEGIIVADTKAINTPLIDDDYFTIGAVDNDTNLIVEVARAVGAAEPNFQIGRAGNITLLAASTLDVSAGTLTLAADQISGDKVEGGTIASITISALAGAIDFGGNAASNIGAAGNDFGASNTLVATTFSGTLTLGAQQLQFFDAAVYIQSLNDGHLDLEADISIDLNAPVALGGKLDAGAQEIDISGGTLTLAADQISGDKVEGGTIAAIAITSLTGLTTFTASGDLDIGAHDFRAQTLTADALTVNRVVFAGVNGLLSDDADFTFSVDTLTVTKIATTTFTGTLHMGAADIDMNGRDILGVANIKSELDATDYLSWEADDQFDVVIDSGVIASFQDDTVTMAKILDLSSIGAGNPLIKVVATTDAAPASWGAAAGYEVDEVPTGWIEGLIGATPIYIPYWT